MWLNVALALIVGYLCVGRSFAYWGIPQWNLFVAEIVLGSFLLCGPISANGRWPWAGIRAPQLKRLNLAMALLMMYGIFEVLRGWSLGHPVFTSVRDLAFNIYPLYLFLGIWVGQRRSADLAKYARTFGWINGVYGIAFVLFLTRLDWLLPGISPDVTPVSVFGQPEHSGVVILALLAFEPNIRRVWHLLLMNSFVLLGMQIRAAWLGFCVALLLWAFLSKQVRRLAWGAFGVIVLLGVMYVANIQLEGPQNRDASAVSARDIIGRAVAPFAPDLAADYSDNSQTYEGTAVWRTVWWVEIWNSVHETTARALLGHGYGYALGDLSPFLDDVFIRTPHNVFFYALGYTGWIGVALFLLFQAEFVRLLWGTWRQTGQPFGLVFWFALMVYACFTPFFETPQGAIPFYLIIGWILAPALNLARKPEIGIRKPVSLVHAPPLRTTAG